MLAAFKFFKVKNGIPAVAEVTVEAAPSQNFAIEWEEEVEPLHRWYGDAVRSGIQKAFDWTGTGATNVTFTVRALTEFPADTKPDAIECAAAAAAWKALGHSENDLVFSFTDRWNVSLRSPS